ncbi:MAG: hemolysin family protein [Actinomycetota bacterium]|nr:hemolysin family protein [Actinomycetota bacterium]
MLGLLVVFGLILLHGFFVAGEFGIVAIDRNKVEQLASQGDRRAKSALLALKSLSFQLSGAQLGITITSLLVGFLIEPAVAPALEPLIEAVGLPQSSALGVSVGLGLALATAFEMVVAELIPKNLAIARPEAVTFALATPFRLSNAAMKPFILLFNSAANWTVRLVGIEPQEELSGVQSLEELQVLIRSSREGGAIDEEEFSLLARSITFGDKVCADALTPRVSVTSIPRDATVGDLRKLALETGHSRFPVTDEGIDDIIGVVHVKDSYAIPAERRDATPIAQIVRQPLVVPESRDLASLLVEMRRDRQQLVIVVDEYGGTAGIISLEDLLEEIVGEIEDEYDPRTGSTSRLTDPPSGIHVVPGTMRAPELFETTGFRLPDGDYDTLAGLLLTLFDRVPSQGDHVSYEGWEFKVVEMERNRIARVLVVAPPSTEDR